MEIDYSLRAMGTEFFETLDAVKKEEDWSGVRSRSRAERRRRRGFKQNIKTMLTPTAYMCEGKAFVHPDIMAKLRARVSAQMEETALRSFFGS